MHAFAVLEENFQRVVKSDPGEKQVSAQTRGALHKREFRRKFEESGPLYCPVHPAAEPY